MSDKPNDLVVIVSLDVIASVIDVGALRSFLEGQYRKHQQFHLLKETSSAKWPVLRMVREALIYSSNNPPPETYGIRMLPNEGNDSYKKKAAVRIRQIISVFDEIELWKYATDRYRICYFAEMATEKPPEKMTLPTAVLEAVILSNENPNPIDYGLEIDTFAACVLRHSPSQPRSYQDIEASLHR